MADFLYNLLQTVPFGLGFPKARRAHVQSPEQRSSCPSFPPGRERGGRRAVKPPEVPRGVAGRVCRALMVVVEWSVPHPTGRQKEKKNLLFCVLLSLCLARGLVGVCWCVRILSLPSALPSSSSGQGTDVCPAHAGLQTDSVGGTALPCSEFYFKICLDFGDGREIKGHPGVINPTWICLLKGGCMSR